MLSTLAEWRDLAKGDAAGGRGDSGEGGGRWRKGGGKRQEGGRYRKRGGKKVTVQNLKTCRDEKKWRKRDRRVKSELRAGPSERRTRSMVQGGRM